MVLDEDEVHASRSDLDGSDLSLKAQVDTDDVFSNMILDVADFPEAVEQEDGYISPCDNSRGTEELSSPIWPSDHRKTRRSLAEISQNPHGEEEDADFAAQVLSSPIYAKRREPSLRPLDEYETPVKWTNNAGNKTILAERTPTPTKQARQELDDVPSPTHYRGPDLRSMLGVDYGSELDIDTPCGAASGSSSTAPPTPSPETPGDSPQQAIDIDGLELDLEAEEQSRSEKTAQRTKAVMDGWRRKWALPSLQADKSSMNAPKAFALGSGTLRAANLRRSETTVIMSDSQPMLGVFYKPPKSAPSKISAPSASKKGKLVFESTKLSSVAMRASKTEDAAFCTDAAKMLAVGPGDSEAELDIVYKARTKLSQYRLVLLTCSARPVLNLFHSCS